MKPIETIGELETAMNGLQACDAKINKAAARLSAEIAERREKMNADLGTTVNERARLQNVIEQFAWDNKTNPEIFPAGKKSLALAAGTISFKIGDISVTLKKGTTTEKVIELARGMKLGEIVRVKEEIDKKTVKDLIDEEKITDDILKQLGLVVNQSENLTIKLNDQ